MTEIEKAIEILKSYKQRLEESVSTELGNDIKAFEMAISALENNYNSEENNDNDLISKQDILFSLSYYELEDVIDEQDFGFNHAIQTIRSDVMEMKTYSVQTVKEDTAECYKAHEMIEDRLHCRNCGLEKVITGHWKEYNFCPKCGRKIDIYKTPYRQNDE